MSNKPEKVFKVGPVRASVFQNVIHRDGKQMNIPKVVLEVRYKDKTGQWRGTKSFSLNELPKAILALQKTFAHLTTHREPDTAQSDAESRVP